VLITGAAHGLGRALAAKFLAGGWQIIATDVDDLSMAWMLDQKQARVFKMDITSDSSVQEAFRKVEASGVRIDLIINNAGIDRYFPLSETPVDMFRQVFEVNVFGGYRVNQVFLPLVRRPGGRIIHISSESLNLTVPFMPYPMSKKLVESYAKSLRIELGFLGIDVVIVRPGAIRTKLLETVSGLEPAKERSMLKSQFEKFAEQASGEIGKTLSPEQAAAFIYRVASIKHPPAVYRINNMLSLKMAGFLPFGLLERLIRNRLR